MGGYSKYPNVEEDDGKLDNNDRTKPEEGIRKHDLSCQYFTYHGLDDSQTHLEVGHNSIRINLHDSHD